ncbi:hypothetical protein ABPG72_011992 [Tetrahymena utriculariae]
MNNKFNENPQKINFQTIILIKQISSEETQKFLSQNLTNIMKKYFPVTEIKVSTLNKPKINMLIDVEDIEEDISDDKINDSQYKFQEKWKNNFLWLLYQYRDGSDEKKMYCSYCINLLEYQQKQFELRLTKEKEIISNVFIDGCSRFKFKALTEHSQATSHKLAVEYHLGIQKTPTNIFEVQIRNNVIIQQLKPLFLAQFYICLVGKFLKDIPWLISVHCRAHLANLGLNDCLSNFEIMRNTHKTIFKFCSLFNSKKANNFQILLSAKEEEILELEEQIILYQRNKLKPKLLNNQLILDGPVIYPQFKEYQRCTLQLQQH